MADKDRASFAKHTIIQIDKNNWQIPQDLN
jgi:hypothetical protein